MRFKYLIEDKTVWREGNFQTFLEYHPDIKILEEEYGCLIGNSIPEHIKECIKRTKLTHVPIVFEGNGINFHIDENTPENLFDDAELCWTYEIKDLGPKRLVIDPEYKLLMDPIIEMKSKLYKLEFEVSRLKEDINKAKFNLITKTTEYLVSNKESYNEWLDNNQSAYGKVCIEYAVSLGKLLQSKFDLDKLDVISENQFNECDNLLSFYGITGFQFGYVKRILKETWKYADKLQF